MRDSPTMLSYPNKCQAARCELSDGISDLVGLETL